MRRGPIVVVVLAALLGCGIVFLGPSERTMGTGIRLVYVHVALTLAGAVGLVGCAVVGIGALVSGSAAAGRLVLAIERVALGMLAAGTVVSVLAAWVNWGGAFLDEPLLRASLVVLASGFLSFVLATWIERPRIRGLLGVVPALALAMSLRDVSMLLHPGAMVLPRSEASILWTFIALTALAVAAGAALVWRSPT